MSTHTHLRLVYLKKEKKIITRDNQGLDHLRIKLQT